MIKTSPSPFPSPSLRGLFLGAAFSLVATFSAAAEAPATAVQANPAVLISADEMSHDRELGLVRASGSVEVNYEGRTLLSSSLVYNQGQDVLTASGGVTILETTGDVVFADYMELSGDLKNGVIHALRIRLSDRSRIAAARANRKGGTVMEMDRAVYSPCEPCKKDPSRPPLWQMKAVKVIHDQNDQSIEYKDAWIELAGIPVFYTPYLTHPDPTVKRQSGFLAPSFGGSTDLGFLLRTPYYWNIAPDRDATITPILTGHNSAGAGVEYRQLLQDGEIDGEGSIIWDDGHLRGHIDAETMFDIDETWRWGADMRATSTDTYLRRYGFPSDDVLQSRLYVEGFRQRNYLSASAIGFQDLRADNDPDNTPLVLPQVEFQHVGTPNRYGLRSEFDASFVALTRSEGQDTRRLSMGGGWVLPHTSPSGHVTTLSTTLQGDLYHVNSLTRDNETGRFSGFTGRLTPEAKMEWRYPLVRDKGSTYQVFEPVVSGIISPYGGNPNKVPNEDSQDFEFDDTNLFSSNRFAGYDRVEGGPRINYGLKWGVFGARGGATTIIVGQSARLKDDDTFSEGSGLNRHVSDIVAAVHVAPTSNLDIHYRTRLDKSSLDPRRNEFRLSAGPPLLKVNLNYVQYDRLEGSEFEGREQISTTISSQFSRFWRGQFSSVRDLDTGGGQRSLGLGATYEDECLIFSTNFTRSFFEDRDLKPSDAVIFRLAFKTLGEVKSGTSLSN